MLRHCFKVFAEPDQEAAHLLAMRVERKQCDHDERQKEAGTHATGEVAAAQRCGNPVRKRVGDGRGYCGRENREALGWPLPNTGRPWTIVLDYPQWPRGLDQQGSNLSLSLRGKAVESQAADFPMFICPSK
jgi:hypothetical protein